MLKCVTVEAPGFKETAGKEEASSKEQQQGYLRETGWIMAREIEGLESCKEEGSECPIV